MSSVPNGDSRDSKAGRGEAGREEEGRGGRQAAISHIKAIGAVIRNDGQQLESPCSALSASLCSLGDPLCLPTRASPCPGSSISPDIPLPEAAPSQIRSDLLPPHLTCPRCNCPTSPTEPGSSDLCCRLEGPHLASSQQHCYLLGP